MNERETKRTQKRKRRWVGKMEKSSHCSTAIILIHRLTSEIRLDFVQTSLHAVAKVFKLAKLYLRQAAVVVLCALHIVLYGAGSD